MRGAGGETGTAAGIEGGTGEKDGSAFGMDIAGVIAFICCSTVGGADGVTCERPGMVDCGAPTGATGARETGAGQPASGQA